MVDRLQNGLMFSIYPLISFSPCCSSSNAFKLSVPVVRCCACLSNTSIISVSIFSWVLKKSFNAALVWASGLSRLTMWCFIFTTFVNKIHISLLILAWILCRMAGEKLRSVDICHGIVIGCPAGGVECAWKGGCPPENCMGLCVPPLRFGPRFGWNWLWKCCCWGGAPMWWGPKFMSSRGFHPGLWKLCWKLLCPCCWFALCGWAWFAVPPDQLFWLYRPWVLAMPDGMPGMPAGKLVRSWFWILLGFHELVLCWRCSKPEFPGWCTWGVGLGSLGVENKGWYWL